MLVKTDAVVLSAVRYGDSSVVLKTYTRQAGLKSFIAGGLHSKKGVIKASMIQPATLLSLVYYDRSKSELKRIKEASVQSAFQHLPYEPVKSSLAMFLTEILVHVIHEAEPDAALFDFLSTSFIKLDRMEKGHAAFHLHFLFGLSHFLGFAPEAPERAAAHFDLMSGTYSQTEPSHPHYLGRLQTQLWSSFYQASLEGESRKLQIAERDILLDALLEYYRLHIRDFGKLKSLDILKELLS